MTLGYIIFVVCFNNYDFAIPFRSNIKHRDYFKTSDTIKAGIDYSKSILIPDNKYIDSRKPVIRKDEASKVIGKDGLIKREFIKYIDKYIAALEKLATGKGDPKDYNICKFSSLQNFHPQLKISYVYSEVMDLEKLTFIKKPENL